VPFFVILALWVGLLVVFLMTVLGAGPVSHAQAADPEPGAEGDGNSPDAAEPTETDQAAMEADTAADSRGSNAPREDRLQRERFTGERFTLKREHTTGLALVLKILIFLIFTMMLLTPFIPGIIELQNPTDEEALPVDLKYARDPRYFGHSFRKIVDMAVESSANVDAMAEVKLSHAEQVEVCGFKRVGEGDRVRHVVYVRGDLEMGNNSVLQKEARVVGNAFLQNDCFFRAMAVDGNVVLGPRTRLARWLDAEGNIMVEDACQLGISCASAKTIMLGRDTEFRRLLGAPVRTHADQRPDLSRQPNLADLPPVPKKSEKLETIEDDLDFVKGDLTVYENDTVKHDLVVAGDLNVKAGVVFRGSIRTHGTAVLGRGVIVHGNLFCEGAISLDDDCQVLGNIFGQDTVFIGQGCRVGQRDKVKSVIGKKAVSLAADVIIYGYVLTEGRGRVL